MQRLTSVSGQFRKHIFSNHLVISAPVLETENSENLTRPSAELQLNKDEMGKGITGN
ncbi:Uncharacterized protein TCM_016404 [Theobroma cacao]|uniref:Uncharacterized protein n=1 Tax=Theobroma cacao TaxID=3641 RepID=A0A061G513_THECC|nr:Uncharacterized protein TCM_016404 [Theobroma cacao]